MHLSLRRACDRVGAADRVAAVNGNPKASVPRAEQSGVSMGRGALGLMKLGAAISPGMNTPLEAWIREDRLMRGMARMQPGLSPCSAQLKSARSPSSNPGVAEPEVLGSSAASRPHVARWVWRQTTRVVRGLVMRTETASLGARLARPALSMILVVWA